MSDQANDDGAAEAAEPPKGHPLQLRGVLEFAEGQARRQGVVLDVFGETAVVQLFDWIGGDPTTVALVPIGEMGDFAWRNGASGWLLFASNEARNEYYERYVGPFFRQRSGL